MCVNYWVEKAGNFIKLCITVLLSLIYQVKQCEKLS